MEKINTPIDGLIITALKKSKEPLSTYGLAKHTGVSWSTVNAHCYKLKSGGAINERTERSHAGQKKVLWYLLKNK